MREKTGRIGFVARTLAIFRVEEVLVYTDQNTSAARNEAKLLEKILRFQETPQYLRRELFKVDSDLAFAGVLPPLRTPHHPDRSAPKPGMIREAAVVSGGPLSTVNAGFTEPVIVQARLQPRARVTVRVRTTAPRLEGELVETERLAIYWGPKVHRDDRTLGAVITQGDYDLIISTSRHGNDVREVMDTLRLRWRISQRPVVLFGSPSEGVPEILARERRNTSPDFTINTMPEQGVETIRTEEALLGALSVLNLLEEA